MLRLWKGWWACKGVRLGEGSWSYCKAAESSLLSETVSDSATHTRQMCAWKRFHVSLLLGDICGSLLLYLHYAHVLYMLSFSDWLHLASVMDLVPIVLLPPEICCISELVVVNFFAPCSVRILYEHQLILILSELPCTQQWIWPRTSERGSSFLMALQHNMGCLMPCNKRWKNSRKFTVKV